MKKLSLVLITLVAVSVLVIGGCKQKSSTPEVTITPPATEPAPQQ